MQIIKFGYHDEKMRSDLGGNLEGFFPTISGTRLWWQNNTNGIQSEEP